MSSIFEDLMRDEGFRPEMYQDHLGFWTIGIGFMIDTDHPGHIKMTKAVANLWLLEIISERKKSLDDAIPWWRNLDDGRQRALLNMAYQLGVTGLLNFEKTLTHLEAGRYSQAAEEALDSRWASQTPNRAARVAELIRNG